MAEVIRALTDAGHHVVITSGPDEKERRMVDAILSACQSDKTLTLAGRLTLRQLAALIDHASLFIGVDSVPMHMAAALQTPLIALFGPSKLMFWHPRRAKARLSGRVIMGSFPIPTTSIPAPANAIWI